MMLETQYQIVTMEEEEKNSPSQVVERTIDFILENFAKPLTLDDLAMAACRSKFNFCRRFHRECGLSPMRWLWTFRTVLAAEFMTLDPNWALAEVAFACGFTSSAHFSRSFRQIFKMSPSQYRKMKVEGRLPFQARILGLSDVLNRGDQVLRRAAVRTMVGGKDGLN